jgi:glycosyltransferase involved in cell wall biosynthesis
MDTTTENLTAPLVTILMLTYNRAHFLPAAIESVLGQTYTNWELVVIDDGSTDTTVELMKKYSDARIRYIRHEQNAGLFVRRKKSLAYATGIYTAVLDSDDYWTTQTKLTEQVTFLENHTEYVVVGTQTELIDAQGHSRGQHFVATTDNAIRHKILSRNQFVHSSLLIRTAALKKTTGYQATLAEDLELILQLGTLGKVANLSQVHTAHRVHSGSQNDHGRAMALAVDTIVSAHAQHYPNSWRGKIFSKLRLLKSYVHTH